MSCKDCERLDALMNLEVEQLVLEQLALEHNLVSIEERNQRLDKCQTCQYCSSHTCLKCGCLVLFRASLVSKKCPVGRWG